MTPNFTNGQKSLMREMARAIIDEFIDKKIIVTTLACERAQRAVLDDVAESAAVAAQKVAVGAARDAVRPTALTRMKQAALNALATTSVIALLWAVYRGISFYLLRGN